MFSLSNMGNYLLTMLSSFLEWGIDNYLGAGERSVDSKMLFIVTGMFA